MFVEKRQFFNRNNQRLNNIIVSLNSQFTVVLNGIICFSVRFCDNSLLVLKMRFQVFSFASKKVQGFSRDMKILMSLLSVSFHLQKCVSVFWNFDFYPRYLGKHPLWSCNQSHFLRNSHKSLRHSLVDERQLKTLIPKKLSPIWLLPFCSSKPVHFFKFPFRETEFLRNTFPTSFENVSFSQ